MNALYLLWFLAVGAFAIHELYKWEQRKLLHQDPIKQAMRLRVSQATNWLDCGEEELFYRAAEETGRATREVALRDYMDWVHETELPLYVKIYMNNKGQPR